MFNGLLLAFFEIKYWESRLSLEHNREQDHTLPACASPSIHISGDCICHVHSDLVVINCAPNFGPSVNLWRCQQGICAQRREFE